MEGVPITRSILQRLRGIAGLLDDLHQLLHGHLVLVIGHDRELVGQADRRRGHTLGALQFGTDAAGATAAVHAGDSETVRRVGDEDGAGGRFRTVQNGERSQDSEQEDRFHGGDQEQRGKSGGTASFRRQD